MVLKLHLSLKIMVSWKEADSRSGQSESEVVQSCLTLCNPVDCSLPGFSVHGILQARILEWVTISFSRGSSRPRDRTRISHIGGRRFNLWATRKAHIAKLLQSCPTLCDPIDGSPPRSSIHGIFQARILEWVTISSSRNSSQPRAPTHVSLPPVLAGIFFTAEPHIHICTYIFRLITISVLVPLRIRWVTQIRIFWTEFNKKLSYSQI